MQFQQGIGVQSMPNAFHSWMSFHCQPNVHKIWCRSGCRLPIIGYQSCPQSPNLVTLLKLPCKMMPHDNMAYVSMMLWHIFFIWQKWKGIPLQSFDIFFKTGTPSIPKCFFRWTKCLGLILWFKFCPITSSIPIVI